MCRSKILFIVFFLYSISSFSQITFEKTYSLFDNPKMKFVEPLQNGGFILCGKSNNAGDNTSDFCFFKTDDYGNIVWSKQMHDTTFMGSYPTNEWATTIREKTDGSFIFGGSVKDPSYSSSVAYYGWLDTNGLLINSTIRFSDWTTSVSALLLNDDGNSVSLRDDREGAGHYGNYLEVNSPAGDFISGDAAGNYSIADQALVKMPDEGYGTLGITDEYYFDPNYQNLPVVARFNKDGNLIWKHTIHNEVFLSDTQFTSLCATPDSGMLLCGYAISGTMFLTKYNSAGDSLWTKSVFIPCVPTTIQQTHDGEYAVCGTLNGKLMLLKLNADADSVWMNTYSNAAGSCSAVYFQQTSDDGYILLGGINTSGTEKIFLVRTDSNGMTNTATLTEKADPAKTLNLYPDPFSSSITISLPGNVAGMFSLRDVTGKIVFRKEIFNEYERFDLSFLPSGIYFATIPGKDFMHTGILMKQ